MQLPSFISNIFIFFRECRRVLNVASRPKKKDFMQIIKVTGAGVVLIGLVGVILAFILGLIS
ncbi:MAG: protein translocase SEC61 complex subunit gamma [Candidatus Micrarchaeota archaeon]|nr:protein translocase SEC61 complex subunit gamma [Candidatus Micrarchaeota archaeon]